MLHTYYFFPMSAFNGVFFFLMFTVCMGTHECHHASLEAREQLWTVSSLMPPLGSPDWNSGWLDGKHPFPLSYLTSLPGSIYLFAMIKEGLERGLGLSHACNSSTVDSILFLKKEPQTYIRKKDNLITNNTDQTRYPHIE